MSQSTMLSSITFAKTTCTIGEHMLETERHRLPVHAITLLRLPFSTILFAELCTDYDVIQSETMIRVIEGIGTFARYGTVSFFYL